MSDTQAVMSEALQRWAAGERERALALMTPLLEAADAPPEFFNNLGYMQWQMGDGEGGMQALETALALRSNYWEAWLNRALIWAQQERWREATAAFEQAQQHGTRHTQVWMEHSAMHQRLQQWPQAIAVLARGLVAQAPQCDLLVPWADVLVQQRDWGGAVDLLRHHASNLLAQPAVLQQLVRQLAGCHTLLPESLPLSEWLAAVELELGDVASGLAHYQAIAQACPQHLQAHKALAVTATRQGAHALAAQHFEQVVALEPGNWSAWNDGACAWRSLGQHPRALEWALKGLSLAPQSVPLLSNVALMHYELHDHDAAQRAVDQVLAIEPQHPEALHTQAVLLSARGQHERALDLQLRVLQLKPDHPKGRLSLALYELMLGRWASGFRGYEHRWAGAEASDGLVRPTIARAPWLGGGVYPGSAIAVLPEQGFGDHVQFARFVPYLRQVFHRVDWLVPQPLVGLLQYSMAQHPGVRVVPALTTQDVQGLDFEIPLMSLPLALGVTLENLPAPAAYLQAPQALRAQWRALLDRHPGLKVGLAWGGRIGMSKHALRVLPVERLPVLDQEGLCFVNLQKPDPAAPQIPRFARWLDWMHECGDFADTAALISELDVVVSSDTVVAHLAGALGKPVFLLNRFGSEWRWLHGRQDSPWYPSMRIFQQTAFKDWDGALEQVRAALGGLLR